jgi:DNA-binding GntR family transcriptional regulator
LHPDQIASLLRRALRQRVLSPGQALNQDDLAKRFGVSRVPLREALRTLASEGLIVMRPGIGAIVTELSLGEVRELYELRLLLEPPLVEATVHHVRQRDIDELADLLRRMEDIGANGEHRDAWSNLNYSFHRRLNELSGKRHHVRLVVQVLNLVEPYSRIHAHVLGSRADAESRHAAMLRALDDRNAGVLRALVVESLEQTRQVLVSSMETAEEDRDPLELLVGRQRIASGSQEDST